MRTLWERIPGWAYGVFFAGLWALVIARNWAW